MTEIDPTLIEAFRVAGPTQDAAPYGSGHIHDTFLVRCADGAAGARYILQRINTAIFTDPAALSRNIARVTTHLRAKLERRGVRDAERRCLSVVATRSDEPFHVDAAGEAWRMFRYIDGTRSVDLVESPAQAHAAARAFGAFAADLADLPAPALMDTIPDFHDLPGRARQLEEAAARDAVGRAAGIAEDLDRARRQHGRLEDARRALGAEELPARIVHNDCKLNNLLLDARSGEALCVIDLDTVMGGRVSFDFGELVRSGTCRSPEDETDLESIRFDRELFEALAQGYLAGAAPILTAAEVAALPLAGPELTIENALRFLADHLDGDRYFRIHREGHNLDRARAQLQLLERMCDELDAMRRAVERADSGRAGA